MEELIKRLLETNVLSNALIQEVFISAKKLQLLEDKSEIWDKITQILWLHLQSGILKLDDQLLCSTCFYTVIPLTEREEFYLQEVLHCIQTEQNQRNNNVMINPKTTLVVSLMYGMFQSNFLTKSIKDNANLMFLLNAIIDLLIQMAYDYSRNTFIVFKTISSLKKVCGTKLQDYIFTKTNQVKLLNLVNHNWENPITGVRDLNKTIYQTLISLMDGSTYQNVMREIDCFYWNKAKYLMLAEMIGQHKGSFSNLIDKSDWLSGLSCSLEKPGLVSAGTDMYFAILKNLVTEEDWIQMFLPTVIKILNGKSTKAIENFNNYWCLQTLKKFPSLINQFEVIFENTHSLNTKLYNCLTIFKQGNKLGLVRKNWSSAADYGLLESMVLQGMEHSNVDIRMAAFEIICEFQAKTIPSSLEFELVLNYLKNNVNSDCTVLRLNMLKCLKNFLMQTHAAFATLCKSGRPMDLQHIQTFLKDLQELVVSNLNVKGNYQRKITSVKVCSIVWECLIDIPKNKKNQTRHGENTLFKMLIDEKQWLLSDDEFIKKLISFLQDPSDDIRENVVHLLLNYYSPAFKKVGFINQVIEGALKSIGGKFFYEISCGQSMFKLIVSILLKEKHELAKFKTVEDVFTFAFNELIQEHDLKRDILESIENGKQLHSFIDIMLVVLDVCDRQSYDIKISDTIIDKLLTTLENISNHFAWEESSSSDFSKMNDMVEHIITNSGFASKEGKDSTKISGVHQMVLNCMWLNVKACCDLASLMIRHCDQAQYIEKFLLIITRVLESSRHKGAIEAAGAALGQAIQYLTSLPDESDISNIPHVLLRSKLKELITEARKMASITRRGAGLSIMVHRIVSSDMKKGKPLFHYFMDMILQTCNQSEDLPEKLQGSTDIDNEKDLPKAIYIHFLTRIVVDSSIASDVMYYCPQLAKLAFDNLTSSHWQIRNAALQLYGALVPKLIGQKKASGSGEETIATVACDEIRTHSPQLWIYINEQLANGRSSDKVLSHSNLVPTLNMLANSAMRYNFDSDTTDNQPSNITLLNSLKGLLDSPIYTVRRLTAKSIFNIFSFDSIYKCLIEHGVVSENFLHGVLMLLAHCDNYYKNAENSTKFEHLGQSIQTVLIKGSHSYLCKEQYERIFVSIITIHSLHETVSELDSNVYAPGIHAWANARIRKCIRNISWAEVPIAINIFLNRTEFEQCCEILHEKIQCQKEDIPRNVLNSIGDKLLACHNTFCSSVLWKILYEISQLVEYNSSTESLLQAIKTNGCLYKLRYLLPFTVRIMLGKNEDKALEYLSIKILELCDPNTVDVDMRYIAALSNNELSNAFNTLSDVVKVNSIKSAVILLQDEDEDVRNLSSIFYKNISQSIILPHPYICLKKLMDPIFLHKILSNPRTSICVLCDDLKTFITNANNSNIVENYNPFANDSKNIYLEVEILQQCIDNLNVLNFGIE